MIEEVLTSCRMLASIPPEAAEAYEQTAERLQDHVNEQLEAHPKIAQLIGRNPFDLMRDNHRNHAAFMTTVFSINSFELLTRTVPWVYRAYHARGFSYDYFLAELVAWQVAIHECLDPAVQKTQILAVYAWMVQHHEDFIKLSVTGEGLSFSIPRETDHAQQVFLSLLLHGDTQGCLMLADQSVHTVDDLKRFYLGVVWPAMSSIGILWESNQISVAEEHLATAIVGRIMAALYPRFAQFTVTRGKAVVSAGPNEFHEIGARMVADFLEMDGWDVTYLGANTPASELHAILKKQKPFIVAISVATVFNLGNARHLIELIKGDRETREIMVLLGGLAFNEIPSLWQEIGADGSATDAARAIDVAREWWLARGGVNVAK